MELSCPAPKHCEYGRKMASAKFSSYDPFKTARLNQAGRKNKLRHSCGVTATLATKNHKASHQAFHSLLRVACSHPLQNLSNSGGPVPVTRWPPRVSVAGPAGPVRWPGPGGPVRWPVQVALVPVARSPGDPVPVARSRWPGPGGPVRWSGDRAMVPL